MELLDEINDSHQSGRPFVLATIVRTVGSSPRKVGARVMVYSDGSISGTIGGGNFEKMVIDDALEMLRTREKHRLKKYKFAMSGDGNTGMCCGGEAEVFLETNSKTKELIIFGGGHVGAELVRLAETSQFQITVIDDRRGILDQLPLAVTAILTDEDYQSSLPIPDESSFVVIATRSHPCDRNILSHILQSECAYVGMIGSRAKVTKMFASLEESGVDSTRLKNIHAPIGINIKAEGPYEIAVAIMAEIISVKNAND